MRRLPGSVGGAVRAGGVVRQRVAAAAFLEQAALGQIRSSTAAALGVVALVVVEPAAVAGGL